MWLFHLTVPSFPTTAPKVKLSHWDKKQSKKQFTLLMVWFLPRGVAEGIYALEGARSQPSTGVFCSGAGLRGLWCLSLGLWWLQHPQVCATASQGKRDLDTLDKVDHEMCSAGPTWQLSSLLLSHFPSSVYWALLDDKLWKHFFLVGTSSLHAPYSTLLKFWEMSLSMKHASCFIWLFSQPLCGYLLPFVQRLTGQDLSHWTCRFPTAIYLPHSNHYPENLSPQMRNSICLPLLFMGHFLWMLLCF